MTMAAVAIGGIGLIGSVAGGQMAASGARDAAQAERDQANQGRAFTDQNYQLNRLFNLINQYGGKEGLARYKAQSTQAQRDQVFGRKASNASFGSDKQKQLSDIEAEINHLRTAGAGNMQQVHARQKRIGDLEAQRQALVKEAGGDGGQQGLVDEASLEQMGPGILSKFNAEAQNAQDQGTANLGAYDTQTANLDARAAGIEKNAENFGQQRVARIKRDSERSLTANDRKAQAALLGRGVGAGSAMTDALRGNAEANQRATEDALGNVEDAQIGMRNQLATGRLGVATSRAQGRDAMMLGGQDAARSLRVGALNMEESNLSSPLNNPWQSQNAMNYFSSASPSAAYGQAWGNSLAGMSSPLMGYGFDSYLANRRASQGSYAPDYSGGGYAIDQSYMPNSTAFGSNRPR